MNYQHQEIVIETTENCGKAPPAREKQPDVLGTTVSDHRRKGVPAFFGIWPGEESDEDFERMLKEVRS